MPRIEFLVDAIYKLSRNIVAIHRGRAEMRQKISCMSCYEGDGDCFRVGK